MNLRQKMDVFPWRLILALGLLALVRPVIKISGQVFEYEVSPMATIAITIVIAVIWISVVVKLRVKNSVIVLALSGVVYGVSSILMAVLIQAGIPDLKDAEAKMPILLTAGLIATTIFNFVYGAFLGLIAQIIQKNTRKFRS